MTRENKKHSIIYAAYKNEEYDCTLCAEAPNLCPYCEGYNPSNSRELDEDDCDKFLGESFMAQRILDLIEENEK